MEGFRNKFKIKKKRTPKSPVQKENNSSPKIKRKSIQNCSKDEAASKNFMFTKFRINKNKKNENQLYVNADISSSENSIQNEASSQRIQSRGLDDNSFISPISRKRNTSSMTLVKSNLSSSPLRPRTGPSPYKSVVTRSSAPLVTQSGGKENLAMGSAQLPQLSCRKPQPINQNMPQLPGLKAAFNRNYVRSSIEKRPLQAFAHNRSFELRLKSAEENLSRAASEEQKDLKQRRWLTRRIETKQKLGGRTSDLNKTEQSISQLAQSNRIAVYHSEPKPVRPNLGFPSEATASSSSNTGTDTMVTSYLSEFEEDSGIFTSSYYSDYSDMEQSSIKLSQSFGKSFPDILEDRETTEACKSYGGNEPKKSEIKTVLSETPPVKPKRSMIINYSKLLSRENPPTSVKDRVKHFETIARSRIIPAKDAQTEKTQIPKASKIQNNNKKYSALKTQKKPRILESATTSPSPSPCPSTKNSSQPTSGPAPVMSISSSSSASCGYKDFLIDDDYVDQPQLLLSRNDESNAKDLDETLKSRLDTFLAKSRDDRETEGDKSEDDCSVREVLQGKESTEDKSSDATCGTLSDQESINSETDCIYTSQHFTKNPTVTCYDIQNQNDILQDVLDINTLLSKLKTILIEADDYNGYINTNEVNEDGEKIEYSEKEIIKENCDLKNQILLLKSQMEEKDKKIKNLENKIQTRNLPTSNAFSQTNE